MLEVLWGAPRRRWVLSVAWPKFRSRSHVAAGAGGCSPEFAAVLADDWVPMLYASVRCGSGFDVKSKRALPPVLANDWGGA